MKNVLEFLEETEQKYPHKISVNDGMFCFDWRELKEFAQRIGSAICNICEAGKPIAIVEEKSTFTLATMLGVVYAGCFYVMVDPSQPTRRIQEIFDVLEPEVVIFDEEKENEINATGYKGKKYILRQLLKTTICYKSLKKRRDNSRETDLLYGIFTSGSTGTPKGVMVNHKAVIDFITHFVNQFGFSSDDKIGNQAPFDFDVSVKDIYVSMATGAELVLIPSNLFSIPTLLLDYLCENEITVLIWAVSALSLVAVLKGFEYKIPYSIKKVFFSGEVMPVKQLRIWQSALPYAEFVNLYGPTEITCNCTYYPVRKIFHDGERIPIGKPLPGRNVFLLDDRGNEITIPEKKGEICVAGESLAEGYYHNKDETDKYFKLCSFMDNHRYYCTGDIGYFGTDGQLYFSGRKDFQIKHMGHRIELEEIEGIMEQIDGVERCSCIMDEKRNRLTAFYLGEICSNDIRSILKKRLPVYMIPHRIYKIDKMPLNKNGKTDKNYFRKKLEEE